MSYQYNDNNQGGYAQGGYGETQAPASYGDASYSSGSGAAAAVIGGAAGGSVAISAQSFEGYIAQEPAPIDISAIQLPPPNMTCYQDPPQPRPEVKYFKIDEPTVTKSITQNFNTSKTVVKENTIHTQHIKNVVINVTRNHWHTQRVVVKDTNYHHYLINNVIKVADVHHQKIEQVRGESKTFNDYKQTQRVEPALCERGQETVGQASATAADEGAVANLVAAPAAAAPAAQQTYSVQASTQGGYGASVSYGQSTQQYNY